MLVNNDFLTWLLNDWWSGVGSSLAGDKAHVAKFIWCTFVDTWVCSPRGNHNTKIRIIESNQINIFYYETKTHGISPNKSIINPINLLHKHRISHFPPQIEISRLWAAVYGDEAALGFLLLLTNKDQLKSQEGYVFTPIIKCGKWLLIYSQTDAAVEI